MSKLALLGGEQTVVGAVFFLNFPILERALEVQLMIRIKIIPS